MGAAPRDENISLRERGGDLRGGRKTLCYLPGRALPAALGTPSARRVLAGEAACFFQDLEAAWTAGEAGAPLSPVAVLDLLDERRAAARPTFVSAAPEQLPAGLERGLRDRLPIIGLDPLPPTPPARGPHG